MRQLSLLLITLASLPLAGQDYLHDLSGISRVVISAETDVSISAHEDTNLVIAEAENGERKRPKDAEGLTSLSSRGQDNTNYGVEIRREGSQLFLTGLRGRHAPALAIRLPRDMNVSVEVLYNDISLTGFQSEIEAINNIGDIILKDITGPVVTQNNNGTTLAVFTEINQASPSSLVATNGDIVVRLPATAAITLGAQTPRGEFLTDFDVELTQKRDRRDTNRTISGTINDGGVSFHLESIHGNIYLRKLK